MLTLDTSVAELNAVGKKLEKKLSKIGVNTVEDLIFYYPFRYEDFSEYTQIADLEAGSSVTVHGVIEQIATRKTWKRKATVTEAVVSDDTGSMKVVWFNQPYLSKNLRQGEGIYLSGKVLDSGYGVTLNNPVYEKALRKGPQIHTAGIIPRYSSTAGLTQKQLRWLISQALVVRSEIGEWLSDDVLSEHSLMPIRDALEHVHFPKTMELRDQALQRLKFDELFFFLLQNQLTRNEWQKTNGVAVTFYQDEVSEFVRSLPFTLTDDQKKSAWQILQDIQKQIPMNRLLEGEVGSGKTIIAALCAFNVAQNGLQTIIMAPTEILAQQHFQTIRSLYDTIARNSPSLQLGGKTGRGKIALITRSHKCIDSSTVSKAALHKEIASGSVDLIIGTHALLQDALSFNSVGLVIVDEQHRFGVEQRKLLHDKSSSAHVPHFLSMTATPIPRSLALTLYGDLDISVIRQLPKDRKKITTSVVYNSSQDEVYAFISEQIAQGRQAYIICPLVDPSDTLGVTSVAEEYATVKERYFSDISVAVLHGKLKNQEKKSIMDNFSLGAIDVLIATTVVEVGVNIPNATVIAIKEAHRFGLAQLYQLRGRVGRGSHASYCYLISSVNDEKTRQRLSALTTAKDSFELSEIDLKLRGPGNVLGISQTGWPTFRLANLFEYEIVNKARHAAEEVMKHDSTLDIYPLLKKKVEFFNSKIHRE